MAIYMDFKAKAAGAIKGDATAANFTDQVVVTSVEFGMGHGQSATSGLATGKVVAKPLVFSKRLDKASPLLMAVCVSNDIGTTVKFNYVYEGSKHTAYYTVQLINAMIENYEHKALDDGTAGETVSLSYQKIEWNWVDGGITALHDLTNQS